MPKNFTHFRAASSTASILGCPTATIKMKDVIAALTNKMHSHDVPLIWYFLQDVQEFPLRHASLTHSSSLLILTPWWPTDSLPLKATSYSLMWRWSHSLCVATTKPIRFLYQSQMNHVSTNASQYTHTPWQEKQKASRQRLNATILTTTQFETHVRPFSLDLKMVKGVGGTA